MKIIYDIDDTLVENLPLFYITEDLLSSISVGNNFDLKKILEELPKYPDVNKIVKVRKNEEELIKKVAREEDDRIMKERVSNPYTKEAYKDALINTANKLNLKVKESDLEILASIPFHFRLKKKKTLKSISYLANRFMLKDTVIYSKGKEETQFKKIEELGIEVPLKNIYIVRDKNKRNFEEIVEDLKTNSAIVIGNSLKEDINPALDLASKQNYKITALWVKHKDYFSKGITMNPKTRIYSIQEFRRIIDEFRL